MKLVAIKKMTYSTRHLVAGEEFDARDRDARILVGIKKARYAPPPRANGAASEVDQLRAEARAAGIDVDNRWGARRLRFEIDRKRGVTS